MSETSFFSQLSSFFGGASNSKAHGGSRRNTAFTNGPSPRRGPPQSLDPSAWSLPYSNTNNIPASPAAYMNGSGRASPVSGQYPPIPARAPSPYAQDHPLGAVSTSSVAEFSNMYPTASSSNSRPRAYNSSAGVGVSAGSAVPSNAYPPMRHTWNRIRKWCNKKYPEVGDTLNWPCTHDALDELEMTVGYTLPTCVRESYLNYNGQESESNQSCSDGLFFGATLLSLEQIAEEWMFWRAVDEDPETGANPDVRSQMTSCPHKWIRAEYSCRGWIPLITDRAGNYIGIDLSPHPAGGGSPGQVIIFGRDFDTKVVCWKGEGEGGWGRFLQTFADELEAGEFCTLEENSSGSDDEEDSIGYESYFSGGGAGGSKGGGDRGGEGSAGFRLAGEYKGWPVLEAWADRSMRMWESVGLVAGKPTAPRQQQTQQQTQEFSLMAGGVEEDGVMGPSLRVVEDEPQHVAIEEFGPSRSAPAAVGKELAGDVSVDGPAHPLADSSLPGDTSEVSLLAPVAEVEPPGANTSLDAPSVGPRQPSGMLSPPVPETKASLRKQKQREEGWGSPVMNQGTSPHIPQQQLPSRRKPTRPAPAPVAFLDLPTIEDVKAVQAAAMANDGKSHNIQFDTDYANATQGRSSFSNRGFRDLASKIGAPASSRRDESVELESRHSIEDARANASTPTSANNSYIVGSRGRARGLGNDSTVDVSRTSRDSRSNGATDPTSHQDTMKAFNMVSDDTPPERAAARMPSLIDASSVPNSPRLGEPPSHTQPTPSFDRSKSTESEVPVAMA